MADVDASQGNGHVAPMVNFRRGARNTADADAKRKEQAAAAAAAAKDRAEKASATAVAAKETSDLKTKPSLEALSNGKGPHAKDPAPKATSGKKAAAAAAAANGRKPPVPPTERGTADPKATVLRQQMSGHADAAQKKKLREAMAAITKDQYQEIATSSMIIDVAVNGEAVLMRQLTYHEKKPEKPHSVEAVVADIADQADSMKLRENSKDVMNDGLSHELVMMYGAMNALNHVGAKDRVRNGPAESYVAAKDAVEGVKPYQFTPMEQKEHVTLRALETATARVGRTNVKVGQKGPQQVSEAEKERNQKLRDKIQERQIEVLNGVLRDELEKDKETAAVQQEFAAFLQKKSPDLNEHIVSVVSADHVTAFNMQQVVNVTAASLSSKVETEQRKEQARKEKEAKEGPSESAKKKAAKEAEKKSKSDDSKRKRREPQDDKAYDPKQHAESLVKKEKDDDGDKKKEEAGSSGVKKAKKEVKKPSPSPTPSSAKKSNKKKQSSPKLTKAEQKALNKKAAETVPPPAADISDILGDITKEGGEDKSMADVKVKKEDEDKDKKKRKKKDDSSSSSSSSSSESESEDKKKSSKKKTKSDKKSDKKQKDDSSSSSSSSSSESDSDNKKKESKKSSKKDKK